MNILVGCWPEVSLEGLWVIGEQSVDQTKQLHHSLVLSQVLVTLQQEHEVTPITPYSTHTQHIPSHTIAGAIGMYFTVWNTLCQLNFTLPTYKVRLQNIRIQNIETRISRTPCYLYICTQSSYPIQGRSKGSGWSGLAGPTFKHFSGCILGVVLQAHHGNDLVQWLIESTPLLSHLFLSKPHPFPE